MQPSRGKGAVYSWEPEIPESLERAVLWFLLATAARRVRGIGTPHSSMLIHTSMLAEAHSRLSRPVVDLIEDLDRQVGARHVPTLATLRDLWAEESQRVPAQDELSAPVSWEEVLALLPDVLAETRVIVDNYRSTERLAYAKDAPTTVVVIGGNTLSRGLTLEGLVCSYFVRAASAYDTLLQMGRWFGFRRGYGDLVRIWMTADLEAWFFDLATVEEEIRRDIRRYEDEGLSPAELPVKIRSHPAMAITSAAKMRNAVRAEVSYAGSRQQTILFDHTNKDWLRANLNAARGLIRRSLALGSEPLPASNPGRTVFRGIDAASILQFVGDYEFHERAYQMRRDLLMGYIESQNQQGYLRNWNLVIMGHPIRENGDIDLGLPTRVNRITRSRMDMPGTAHANIKSLVSTIDRVADLTQTSAEIRAMIDGDVTDSKLLERREELVGDVGLLCLYPISRDSDPKNRTRRPGKRRRLPLGAVEDVLGVGFFFPESRGSTGRYTYYAADLSAVPVEDADDDIDAVDAADEAAGEAAAQLEA